MKKIIELCDKEIEYTLKTRTKAIGIRLSIYRGGNFVVSAPQNLNLNTIERFIAKKADWVLKKIEYFKKIPKLLPVRNTRKIYLEHKGRAMSLVQKRIEYFSAIHDFKYNKISIKNQKTRWGSCSKKGNLNFNYKIVFLPEQLADYIIVHELCHLKEFNHSRKFWALGSNIIPNYLQLRKELKEKGVRYF